jgi:hypothetical protein
MLIGGLAMAYVNGIGYKQVRPAPEDEIPQRFVRADEVMSGKLWREQLREWDEVSKPNAIAKHQELQSVDPDAIPDDELADYHARCRDNNSAMNTQHMRYTARDVAATGDFLAHVVEWTAAPGAAARGCAAPHRSAGASAELERLIAAIRADPEAQRSSPPTTIPPRRSRRCGHATARPEPR